MKKEVWVGKILPGLIFFSLWLDGWFFPLILFPVLYVLLSKKKSLKWLGFSRQGLRGSIFIGLLILLVFSIIYYPIFLHYLPLIEGEAIDLVPYQRIQLRL
ncbi:MAG: hypothetical protein ACETVR_00960 [Candidatus Bathyarchaeia archaeon]